VQRRDDRPVTGVKSDTRTIRSRLHVRLGLHGLPPFIGFGYPRTPLVVPFSTVETTTPVFLVSGIFLKGDRPQASGLITKGITASRKNELLAVHFISDNLDISGGIFHGIGHHLNLCHLASSLLTTGQRRLSQENVCLLTQARPLSRSPPKDLGFRNPVSAI
jgi:hypothetical protein